MKTVDYGISKQIQGKDFDQVEKQIRQALSEEGFGVLTEIDVKQTLKKKLDVDFARYKILGACNPPFAYKALTEEPTIGLLLPCNVVVAEEDQHVTVAVMRPTALFETIDNPALQEVASQVESKLTNALEKVS